MILDVFECTGIPGTRSYIIRVRAHVMRKYTPHRPTRSDPSVGSRETTVSDNNKSNHSPEPRAGPPFRSRILVPGACYLLFVGTPRTWYLLPATRTCHTYRYRRPQTQHARLQQYQVDAQRPFEFSIFNFRKKAHLLRTSIVHTAAIQDKHLHVPSFVASVPPARLDNNYRPSGHCSSAVVALHPSANASVTRTSRAARSRRT